MINKIKAEMERCLDELATVSPASEEYSRIIKNFCDLRFYSKTFDEARQIKESKTIEFEKFSPNEPDNSDRPEPEQPVAEPVVEAPKADLTMEDVRAMLTEASQNGTQIQPIIAQFVPEGKPIKLSSVPKESYAGLAEVINNAR